MKFKRGDWAAQAGVKQPNFGKVIDVGQDEAGEWINVKLYDLKGNCVGRKSPALGGPSTFEPCCPSDQWRRIEQPGFPLAPTGLYGEFDHLLKDL